MKSAFVALVTIVALMTSVMAQSSRKVLVLPLDGNAPAAQRDALNASLLKLAKAKLSGDVTMGETTFAETAAAVGCDPALASCADQVRSTLAVDELVYGSATTADGTTTVTVTRATAGQSAPKTQVSVISATDPAEQAEAGIEPVFVTEPEVTNGSGSGSAVDKPARTSFFSTTERKVGVAFLAGGVIALVIGFSQWSSAGDLQDDIDAAPRDTMTQIDALRDLEDRAQSKATWGNVFVVLGLASAGVGGYFLWKDRKNRAAASITPAPTDTGTGMTFVLRGRW